METSLSSPRPMKASPKQNVAMTVCLCHPFVPEEEEIFVRSTRQRGSKTGLLFVVVVLLPRLRHVDKVLHNTSNRG